MRTGAAGQWAQAARWVGGAGPERWEEMGGGWSEDRQGLRDDQTPTLSRQAMGGGDFR